MLFSKFYQSSLYYILERVTHIDQDVWTAALTAPGPGETLRYWIETETGVCSEPTLLRGETWQPGGSVTGAVYEYGDSVTVSDPSKFSAQPTGLVCHPRSEK